MMEQLMKGCESVLDSRASIDIYFLLNKNKDPFF